MVIAAETVSAAANPAAANIPAFECIGISNPYGMGAFDNRSTVRSAYVRLFPRAGFRANAMLLEPAAQRQSLTDLSVATQTATECGSGKRSGPAPRMSTDGDTEFPGASTGHRRLSGLPGRKLIQHRNRTRTGEFDNDQHHLPPYRRRRRAEHRAGPHRLGTAAVSDAATTASARTTWSARSIVDAPQLPHRPGVRSRPTRCALPPPAPQPSTATGDRGPQT